ncbi:MAG: PEP/pyruvate-binding domain-containing protein [Pseudomonadota bacterium]
MICPGLTMWKHFKRIVGRKEKPVTDVPRDIKAAFKLKYAYFKELISSNDEVLGIIADLEEKLAGHDVFGMSYVRSNATRAAFHTFRMIKNLDIISGHKYPALYTALEGINKNIRADLNRKRAVPGTDFILPYTAVEKDMIDTVGGKNANLGEIKGKIGVRIPDGFAITTYAYQFFLEQNDLQDEINKRNMQLDLSDPRSMEEVSEEIQRLIITAHVPLKIEDAILKGYEELAGRLGYEPRVSLRSSAIGEDSDYTHAGQYLSALNVTREKIIQTYKYIIASLYTPRGIFYRLNKGIREEDTAMSVGCLEMIDSVVSGVAFSRHPYSPIEDSIVINAVWGLGPYAVDGNVQPDVYVVNKDENFTIGESRTPAKKVQLVNEPNGGIREIAVPGEQAQRPCLDNSEIHGLAKTILALEQHFRAPQDIEWALDASRRLIILQSRLLKISTYEKSGIKDLYQKVSGYPVIIEKGSIAYPGVGCGPAYHVLRDDDMERFPEGAVLIARYSCPKLVSLMKKAKAIVSDAGGITGHMASLAREFKVPTIVGAQNAVELIPPGMEVTVDAYTARVYQGRVLELLNLDHVKETYMKDTPVYRTLESVSGHIIPLSLTDPRGHTFAPEYCASLHDIIRYVHEKSFAEMFLISDVLSEREEVAVRLQTELPISLFIIDLGGGLDSQRTYESRKAALDDITSIPLKAFLRGMTHKDIRWRDPKPISMSGLMSVLGRQMLEGPDLGRRLGDKSYAIISDKYLNFSSRIGYHFCTVDSFCGPKPNENYISFRFKGGAADDTRRSRRARAIGKILEELGFVVTVKGDLINGRIKKHTEEITQQKLDMLGRLNQFTRQMDMLMGSESSIEWTAKAFLEGNYNLDPDFKPAPEPPPPIQGCQSCE